MPGQARAWPEDHTDSDRAVGDLRSAALSTPS
jgi:hypothetical protein